jgi:F-type H+-transporting ATPase subunit delta
MASHEDHNREVGRLYGESILKVAEEQGQAEALLDELDGVVEYLDRTPEFETFLASPLVEADSRTKVIEDAFRGKASDLLVDSLQVINRKGRLDALRAVVVAYRAALRDLRGWMDVRVRTAVPLSEPLRQQLLQALEASTRRKPSLIEQVEPALLGGLVVEIEGRRIDASVASRLHDLSEALLTRASREIHRGSAAYVAE